MSDRTVIYYTANHLNEHFAANVRKQLLKSIGDLPLISVSKKPMDFGENICVGDTPRNHIWTWRQALMGAKAAKTKYIALAEDDIFYSPDHFIYFIPKPGVFGYNTVNWALFTWDPKIFSWTGEVARMYSLICERDLFIETIEELFAKYPDDETFPVHLLGEPGRKEKWQGTTPRQFELFHMPVPNVVVYHEEAIGYGHLGTRKKHGYLRVTSLPYWGSTEDVLRLCQI